MVNEKAEERLSKSCREGNKEIADVEEEELSKSARDFNTTTHLQERLKSLESRIRVVKSDFKTQVEGLRSRMEHLKTNLKSVHGDMDVNSKKIRNDNEASEKL